MISTSGLTKFRYVILALCCTATLLDYATRTNINSAMVSMVHHVGTKNESILISDFCPLPKLKGNKTIEYLDGITTFDWTPTTQGLILGSFYYGYVILQVPAGRMAEVFGGKWIIGIAILSSGIINVLTPLLANWGVAPLITSRILLGLVQGGVFPACFSLVCQWLAPSEKSWGFGLVNVGGNLGAVAAASLTGVMSHQVGWPYSFYTIGTVAIVWTFLWLFIVRQPTSSDTVLLKNERTSSETSVGNKSDDSSSDHEENQKPPVPWFKICTNPAVISAVITRFGAAFAYLTLQTKIPGYLKDIMHVSDATNGMLTSLLYIAVCLAQAFSPYLSEIVITREWLSRTNTRKAFTGISLYGCVICFIVLPFVGCSAPAAMALLIGFVLYGMTCGGDLITPAEMSNHFPATIYSIINAISNSAGMVAPVIIGFFLDKAKNGTELKEQWDNVFYMVAGVVAASTTTFMIFGSAEIQSFDYAHCDDRGCKGHKYNPDVIRRRSRQFTTSI